MAAELIDGRGGAARGLPASSTRTCPSAGSSCSSARWRRVERHDDGAITVAHLTKSDYEETGALETDSEGVVDHMRAVEGTRVAVLVRELLADDREGMRKVSLRATDGSRGRVADRPRVRRRRAPAGGGLLDRGCRTRSWSTSCARTCASSCRRADVTRDGRRAPARAKPAGVTSHDVVAEVRRSLPRGTKVGHAGTLDPFATGPAARAGGPRDARAALLHGRCRRPTGPWRGSAGPRHRRPRRRAGRDRPDARARSRSPSASSSRRPPAYSAVKVGGGARLRAGPARRDAGAGAAPGDRATAPTCSGTRATAPPSRSSARRAPTCARWSPTSATPTARSSSAPRSGRSGWRTRGPPTGRRLVPLREALAFLPERPLDRRGGGRRASRAARAGARGRGRARCGSRTTATCSRSASRAGERAAARRSVRARMKVVSLPDVEPGGGPRAGRHRHVRRRAPRAPRGDPRRGHGAHVRPASDVGDPPRGHAAADLDLSGQARPDRGAGRGGARGDPVRQRLRLADRRGVRAATC